jgi:hypothetical protein
MRYVLGVMCLLLLGAGTGGAQPRLQPIVVDQEQIFAITWQVGEDDGRPLLSGRITNTSFYATSKIQLLVDQLDAAGRIVHQQLAWLGIVLLQGEGTYFDVPVADRTARYDVRVYAFLRGFDSPNK